MDLPSDYSDRRACIVGLGYTGLTLAVALAEVGFIVYGVEKSSHIRSCLAEGRAHFTERGLNPRLGSQLRGGRISVCKSIADAPPARNYIVTVGTPLRADTKKTSLDAIQAVVAEIADRLTEGDMVIIRSTVPIGVTRGIVKPLLDTRRVAYDLAFCPERTIEGEALAELRSLPQIVGALTESAAIRAATLFGFLTPKIVRVQNLETAEMIKLVNNTQRDLLFAFANEVAEFCDCAGISATEVISAGNMGYDRASMPKPGPVGGPCLAKDAYIFAESVEMWGGTAPIARLGRRLNESLPQRTARYLLTEMQLRRREIQGLKVSLMGIAFKGRPVTSDLRGTLAIPLIASLRALFPKVRVWGYDPAVPENDIEGLGIRVAETAADAFHHADLVVFHNNNPHFEQLNLSELSYTMARKAMIYDYWTQFDCKDIHLRPDVSYAGLGSLANPVNGAASL